MDWEWFKFGGVRGLIGFIVLAFQAAFLSSIAIPSLQIGTQDIVNSFDIQQLWLFAIVLMVIVSWAASGIVYCIGGYLVKAANVRTTGFWRVALAGVIGAAIVGLILVVLLYLLNATVCIDSTCSQTYIITALVGLPSALIAEVGFAALTWWFYKGMEWQVPQ
ncbi:hypothetical protein DRP07_00055 [Archaeoglobales archaeon]|nr:MAG: hypothetical protein DRP07_00055 [Archaeoglobales archaeon]